MVTNEDTLRQQSATEKHKQDEKILDYLITIIGFGLCRSWIILCLSVSLSFFGEHAFNWLYLAFGSLVAFFIAHIAKKHLQKNVLFLRRTFYRISGSTLFCAALIIPSALLFQNIPLLLFGFITGGIGAGFLQVLWGEQFARHEIRFATIASPAAAIVTALFVSLSSTEANIIAYVLFPLFSFGLLLFMAERKGLKIQTLLTPFGAKKRSHAKTSAPDPSSVLQPQTTKENEYPKKSFEVAKLMFSIMAFSFLCRLFDTIPRFQKDPFALFGGGAIFSLVVVGSIFLAFVFVLKDRFNPTFTYRLSLPTMVAGFVAIVLFFDTHAAISVLLINIGYEFFDILSWILFTDIARRKDENSLHVFGLGVAFTFAGMALGAFGGNLLDSLIANGTMHITAIAMVSILCLVIIAFLVIPERTIEQLTHVVRPEKRDDPKKHQPTPSMGELLESSCVSVSEAYRLTPRESEVLVLLAYGRTLSIIARDLHIAKGTARTHIENIYRKLDVHKQQELIDFIENYEPHKRYDT